MKKLTPQDYQTIHELKAAGFQVKEIARIFSISRIHVWRILTTRPRTYSQTSK